MEEVWVIFGLEQEPEGKENKGLVTGTGDEGGWNTKKGM